MWSLSKKNFFNIAETAIIIMVFSFLFFVSSVSAANEQYPVDEQVVIGEFLYDDDYVATTTDCFIDIWAPYKDENSELVSIVTNVKMSTSTTGWHYYNFVGSSTPGIWPATMKCGTAGVDLIKGDKTFVLTTTTVVQDVATAVWNNTERTLTDYATSSIAERVWNYPGRALDSFTTLVQAVWGNIVSERSLTTKQLAGGGNLATESYINMATSSLSTTLETASSSLGSLINTRASLSNQEAGWTVNLSDFGATVPEEAYQARLQILNHKTEPTAPDSAPTWVIYDAAGTPQADGAMTTDSTGTYSYSFTVPTAGVSGVWETVVTVVVGGKTLRVNDYWEVQSSPAHVSVDYMTDDEISETDESVSAFVTIINEGFSWYEYHYEYCVVTSSSNACGGDDDVFHGTGSTKIDSKKTYNTTLMANNITSVGIYYFKLIVYYGTDRSGASISFPVTMSSGVISCGDGSCNGSETCSSCSADCGRCPGGPGGGGGGSTLPPVVPAPVVPQICDGADFNHDKKVNSTDFSILLAFWKTATPFRNACVDINTDNKVDSVDFSILMYQWGTKK